MDKISFKNDTKCIIYTHRRSDVSPYKACNSCIDLLGNIEANIIANSVNGMHTLGMIRNFSPGKYGLFHISEESPLHTYGKRG